MEFQEFKNLVTQKAEAMGLTHYELYYQAEASTSVSAFQHEINEFSSALEGGVCFRCIVNGKMGYASTQALTPEEAAAIVERAMDNAAALEAEEQVFLVEGGKTYAPLNREPYALPETQALIDTVLSTQEKLYAADPMVVDGCATQGFGITMKTAICNSLGLDVSYENTLSALVVSAVVSDGEQMEDDYQFKVGKLDTLDTQAAVSKAVTAAKEKLIGQVPQTQVCPVVFTGEAMSDLLATFSGVFSSEAAQKGLSRLAGQEGTVIAAPVVTLVDDPFYKDSPMPMPFDAEGYPTSRKNVIAGGRLETLLYNLKTAAVAGKTTTGNASKAGYDGTVGISPFTMYLEAGKYSQEELLKKAGNGVCITSLGGLHAGANPITGDFSLQSQGYLIENGEKTVHVKSFTVAGNFYDLLKNITALSNTVELPRAFGKTAFGSPWVLAENLSIAGK